MNGSLGRQLGPDQDVTPIQAQINGEWTAAGLARQLGVPCKWVDLRIAKGQIAAHRHAVTGHYLIPDQPDVVARLQASIAHT